MFSHLEYAMEAVRARREGRFYACNEIFLELEALGCSTAEIKKLIAEAEAITPHPHAPRALRILKAAAKAARRGQEERVESLKTAARELLNEDHEFLALIEEHRLTFAIHRLPAEPRREARHGFALA